MFSSFVFNDKFTIAVEGPFEIEIKLTNSLVGSGGNHENAKPSYRPILIG